MSLDLHTLALVLALVSAAQACILILQARSAPEEACIPAWAVGSTCISLGWLTHALRDLPGLGPWAILLNNLWFAAGMASFHAGSLRLLGRPLPRTAYAGILGALAVGIATATFGQDLPALRTLFISFTLGGFSLALAWLHGTRHTPATRAGHALLAVTFGLFGLFLVLRGLMGGTGPDAPGLFQATPVRTLTYLMSLAAGVFWTGGFILLVSQRSLGEAREARERLDAERRFLSDVIEHNPALIFVKDVQGRYELVNRAWEAATGRVRSEALGRTALELFPGEAGAAFRTLDEATLAQGGVREDEEVLPSPQGDRCFLSVKFPLHQPDGSRRGLCGIATEITQRKADERRIRELVTQLELERDFAQHSALTDGLTRLSNRQHFDEVLGTELYRLRRSGAPLSLILLDVDHFKDFNDRYGHLAGDDCLRRIGQALQAVVGRASDLAARYGGEEFAVILPETDTAGAHTLAERIRHAVEALGIPHEGNSASPSATISLGVVTRCKPDLVSPEQLLGLADEALYRAKRSGRNQVAVSLAGPLSEAEERGLVKLVWRPAADSGHALLDAQHRGLFEASNRLLDAMVQGQGLRTCQELLQALVADVLIHFRTEEDLLRQCGYPYVEQHARLHTELVARAVNLSERLEREELPLGDVFTFLAYEVVAQHMLLEDRKFFPYLAP